MRWIAAGSVAIGAVEIALDGAALTVDGGHNIAGDPASYLIKDAASTHFNHVQPAKVRRRLKIAGYALCITSLFGVGEAARNVYDGTHHEASAKEVGLAGVSMAYGAFAARKLHTHNHDRAHSHGLRHAESDVLSSGVVVLAAVAGSRGIVGADAVGATLAAAITIGFNYPTEARLEHG
jgi:hypothetical protein